MRAVESGGRSHPVFCGAIGIVGAKGPEPESSQVERNPERRAHHRQVEFRAEHEWTDDGGEERQALDGCAGVPVTEARNQREARRPAGVQRPVLFEPLGAIDDLATEGLHESSVLRFCADSRLPRM